MPTGNQRWREGRDSYRPPSEVIRTLDYEVSPIAGDKEAKAFVHAHHYSGSYPAARFRFGLYRHSELVGVAVFSHPCRDSVLTSVFPGAARDSVELGRFVLLDNVPGNGETWFLARCFEHLREHVHGVISFSDPMARTNATGDVVFGGHLGTIYQAHNGVYLGQAVPRRLRLLPDGTVFSDRAISKIRSQDQGWRYSASILESHGADPLEGPRCPREWLAEWLPKLTRAVKHPGNHKYAWAIDRRLRRHLGASRPYPKALAA